jgi:hypothetical protein
VAESRAVAQFESSLLRHPEPRRTSAAGEPALSEAEGDLPRHDPQGYAQITPRLKVQNKLLSLGDAQREQMTSSGVGATDLCDLFTNADILLLSKLTHV